MLEFFAEGVPVAYPRMTNRDKFKPARRVVSYRGWADILRFAATGSPLRKVGARVVGLAAEFVMPLPRSRTDAWSVLHRGQAHEQAPDLSNLIKGLEDALLANDATVSAYLAPTLKRWGQLHEDSGVHVRLYTREDFPIGTDHRPLG